MEDKEQRDLSNDGGGEHAVEGREIRLPKKAEKVKNKVGSGSSTCVCLQLQSHSYFRR